MTDEDGSSRRGFVQEWTEQLARVRFGTQEVNGRKISSAAIKSVGNYVAQRYADWKTGRDVRPGIARVAVELEVDPKTVKGAIAVLRRVGMLLLVAAGGRSTSADEYRLVIPADLLDREDIEVLSPAEQDLAIERTRDKMRGRPTRARTAIAGPARARTKEPADDTPAPPDSSVQAPPGPANPADPPDITGPVSPTTRRIAGPVSPRTQAPQGPATTHRPTTTTTTHSGKDLRTAVTVPV